MVYDKNALLAAYKFEYKTPEKAEKKLNELLEGMIKLVGAANVLVGPGFYFGDYDLEALKEVYNRSGGYMQAIYKPVFEKLSFGTAQLHHVLFLEECKRLADRQLYFNISDEPDTLYDHFQRLVDAIFEQIRAITGQAIQRWW